MSVIMLTLVMCKATTALLIDHMRRSAVVMDTDNNTGMGGLHHFASLLSGDMQAPLLEQL